MADITPPPQPPQPPVPPIPQPPGTVPPPVPPGEAQPLPWEQPGYPLLEAIFETAKLFLTKPAEAFSRMSLTGDLGRPILYAVIFGWVGTIAGQAYNIAFRGAMQNLLGGFGGLGGPGGRMGFGLPIAFNIGFMVLAPIFVLLGIFIWSAIVHLFLMLVGGATRGFGGTVRVMCFGSTVQVLQVIPFCGGIIAFIWALILEIVGLAIAHRTSQGKAALAVLLPLVLCCVCVAVAMIAFGAAIMGAIRGFSH